MNRAFKSILIALICAPVAAQAQVEIDRSVLENYKPPPMFGAPPAPAAPRETYQPPTVPYATPVYDDPVPEEKAAIEPPPLPPIKPDVTPATEQKQAVIEEAPKKPAEIPKKAKPKAPAKTAGVVTGPKTMPAVPSEEVDSETLYRAAQMPKEKTLMERHQDQTDTEQKEPDKLTALKAMDPATDSLRDLDSGTKKLTLPFSAAQTDLVPGQTEQLQGAVAAFLAQNPGWRLQIQAFATSQDVGVSSDRRIALSRALIIRSYLLEQGIEAKRVDVRALGAQTTEKPIDRVDLYLLPPAGAG